MFNNLEETTKMIQGSYRKLKSYYYYNKNFLVMRQKIADFEDDRKRMYETFEKLATSLCHPKKMREYVNDLINKVDFFVVPKKFESESITNSSIISNTISRDKKMKSVNFFIDAPIKLHILDALWTVFLGKMDNDNKVLSYNTYGNTINKSALFQDENIDFESNILFNRYFYKYSEWRNNAFETLETQYLFEKDSVLISLDIKSFFYSVSFSFDNLNNYFDNHYMLEKIRNLTTVMEKIYAVYYEKIIAYRNDMEGIKKKHYPLPIGLFSSMILGNLYLNDFDIKMSHMPNMMYYGRYVDDLLMVVNRTVEKTDSSSSVLEDIFVKNNILKQEHSNYVFVDYPRLMVQTDKIKLLYIDHTESKAIIDIYNDTIRIIPSQMSPLPDSNISLTNFDEVAYTVENFTKEKKIRDIGVVGIDSFKVASFFSALPRKYSQINISSIEKEVNLQIQQIKNFFTGSQSVEFYSNWLNYMYFLTITEKNIELHSFMSNTKRQINELRAQTLDKSMYKNTKTINKKAKEYLLRHLDVCLCVALCLNSSMNISHFNSVYFETKKYINSNMFEHSLVAFPLANYLEYDKDISFCNMCLDDLGVYPEKLEESFKFVWSPRFIHYDELLLLLFYNYHKLNKDGNENYKYVSDSLVGKFEIINHLKKKSFVIESDIDTQYNDYVIRKIYVPFSDNKMPDKVNVAIGSLNISFQKCLETCLDSRINLTLREKEEFFDILRETYECLYEVQKEEEIRCKKEIMFLVLPELCFPIYWINDLIRFSKRTQIGIITGLQYLSDQNGRKYNYLATILPFSTGKRKYKNTFLYIREKNDYSPIEFEELAKIQSCCKNRTIAEYQIFDWRGIRISPMVCYELTDVMVRGLLKGKCDFITASVFNPDTTYFSNIIDSTSRDLHAFVIQANTSFYGDSRVTGPYDRDSKDVFKIKGGENDHVVIGTIDFEKYKTYQSNYYENLDLKLEVISRKSSKNKPYSPEKDSSKPNIKPFSARFRIK